MQLRRDERGITLVELMVAMAVLGIIIYPLSAALIGFMRNTDETTRRMNENHDVQIAAAYFAQDVQALGVHNWPAGSPYPMLQSVWVNVAYDAAPYPCGLPGTPVALVRLAWDDPNTLASNPVVMRVSYVVKTPPGSAERQLHRITCAGSSTPQSDIVLAHNVDTTAPVITCLAPTTCGAAPGIPQQVQLVLTIRDPGNTGLPLTVTLIGQRRQT